MTHQRKEQPRELSATRHKRCFAEILAPLPEGQNGVYGLGRAWQLSPTKVGVVANIRSWGSDVIDLELGNDLLVVDDLHTDKPQAVISLNRAGTGTDPDTGDSYLLSKYPLCGDFVPLGALRWDGSPHPHAGTGFAICTVKRFPLNERGEVGLRYLGEQQDKYKASFELQQYRYDGEMFAIEHSQMVAPNDFLDGWRMVCPPLSNGVPDGEDILMGVIGRPADSSLGVGERGDHESGSPYMARWQSRNGRWGLADVYPVSDVVDYIEPSLIREPNSDLLYSARDWDMRLTPLVSVWRSTDNGSSWDPVLKEGGIRSQAPFTLNQALDGTAYLASCPPEGNDFTVTARARLNLWPLSHGRNRVLTPSTVRDCKAEFGEPRYKLWRVDHPIGTNVRLADGLWHHVLCYRIMEEHGAPPTETTGLYMEEVFTGRTMDPPWKFKT